MLRVEASSVFEDVRVRTMLFSLHLSMYHFKFVANLAHINLF